MVLLRLLVTEWGGSMSYPAASTASRAAPLGVAEGLVSYLPD